MDTAPRQETRLLRLVRRRWAATTRRLPHQMGRLRRLHRTAPTFLRRRQAGLLGHPVIDADNAPRDAAASGDRLVRVASRNRSDGGRVSRRSRHPIRLRTQPPRRASAARGIGRLRLPLSRADQSDRSRTRNCRRRHHPLPVAPTGRTARRAHPKRSGTQPDVNNTGRRPSSLPAGSESIGDGVNSCRGGVAAIATKAQPIEGCGTSRLGRLTCGIAA